jgi:hypothetical protein
MTNNLCPLCVGKNVLPVSTFSLRQSGDASLPMAWLDPDSIRGHRSRSWRLRWRSAGLQRGKARCGKPAVLGATLSLAIRAYRVSVRHSRSRNFDTHACSNRTLVQSAVVLASVRKDRVDQAGHPLAEWGSRKAPTAFLVRSRPETAKVNSRRSRAEGGSHVNVGLRCLRSAFHLRDRLAFSAPRRAHVRIGRF